LLFFSANLPVDLPSYRYGKTILSKEHKMISSYKKFGTRVAWFKSQGFETVKQVLKQKITNLPTRFTVGIGF